MTEPTEGGTQPENPYRTPESELETPIETPPESESRRHDWGGLALGVGACWLLSILIGIGLAIYLIASHGVDGFDPERIQDQIHPLGLLAMVLLEASGLVLVTWLVVCKFPGLSFTEGFRLKPPGPRGLAVGTGIGFLYALFALTMLAFFSTGESEIAEMISTPGGLAVMTIVALLAPFYEELYYRGLIFPVFERHLGAGWAIGITAVWFCLAHVPQLVGDPVGIPVILGLGILLGWSRHRFQSLTAPILIHFVYNALLILSSWVGMMLGE